MTSRRERKTRTATNSHVKVTAALFLAFGALALVGAAVLGIGFGLAASAAGASGEEGAPLGRAMLGLTGIALVAVLLLFAIPALFCGWGLLRTRPWARTLAIVLAAFTLTSFPFGTLFGVYALWVLLQKDTAARFGSTT
jgi:hypothetical protein